MTASLPDAFVQQLDVERKKVDVATHNFSVRELVRMMSDGELDVAPSYQRQFRWSLRDESILVESIFLGLPVPPIFVATNTGFQWEVVDGLQRLSTLAHFLAESEEESQRVHRDSPLVLVGLEKLTELNDVTFDALPRDLKLYFGRQPLQVISLTDKSNLDVRFDVFERLNRGGIRLSPQEVRACVYRGTFNNFIEELSVLPDFNLLLKLQKGNQSDGTTAEEVLKFFSYKNFRNSFDGRVEKFLNRSMVRAETDFDYARERAIFQRSVDALATITGGAFLPPGSRVTPLVQFEACLVGIAEILDDGDEIVPPTGGWMNDSELRSASGAGSNTALKLENRITRAKDLFRGAAR